MTANPAARTVQLAQARFGDNLALAFVGGSHGRGTATATSDIDVFVLLRHSDHPTEHAFAADLRALHQQAGLHFDHCGEVFDAATLDGLLTFTERVLAAAPALQHAACYQADCPLSVFRKGDIVFKFLDDPKIHVHDPGERLPCLQRRAAAYFARWPVPRIQHHKHQLALPPGSVQARLAAHWQSPHGQRHGGTGEWTDTPVGVGLDRWFGDGLPPRAKALQPDSFTEPPADPTTCPLPHSAGTARHAVAAQCLAISQPHPEGS